jgi:hypothetical protein
MNIAIPVEEFKINNIFFQDPIKNTVMNDSNFIRVIYSNELLMINGICIEFNLPIVNIDKSFNKYKCTFDYQLSRNTIQNINKIEADILSKYGFKNKQAIFRISEQLKNNVIKVTNINNININTFLIKISGIWSTELEYGLTYKFSHC